MPFPLIAAPPSPFHPNGDLDLSAVERQAGRLIETGVAGAFVCGTTGEGMSMTADERGQLAARWCAVAKGTPLWVIVHVGSNCAADSKALAAHAEAHGAGGISTLAPSYHRPPNLTALVDWCGELAAAAPRTPFYYYDIPSFTHVHISTRGFLEMAGPRIPTLAGLKVSNPNLIEFQRCRALPKRYELYWGIDEALLAALALGADGAVGSTYNVAASLYHRLIAAFEKGDWETAREEQFRSVKLVDALGRHGFLASMRAVMGLQGVPVGPPRPPHRSLTDNETSELEELARGSV
ncbi:MAG TPA: dihydrodipicolinate synthase family protein [Gemmataceae bacterium]|nr:dihydrodipicolinate synthase family protein [Gemmataceae bacterium]